MPGAFLEHFRFTRHRYTRKWFPLQGELAPLTKKCCIFLVQDTSAGKAGQGEGGEVETTGGYFYYYFYWYFYRSG